MGAKGLLTPCAFLHCLSMLPGRKELCCEGATRSRCALGRSASWASRLPFALQPFTTALVHPCALHTDTRPHVASRKGHRLVQVTDWKLRPLPTW